MNQCIRLLIGFCAALLLCMGPASTAHAVRVAPNGFVTPKKGQFAGKRLPYGDRSIDFTQVAEYTIAELKEFIEGKKPAHTFELQQFVDAMKAPGKTRKVYFGQLSREGYEQYEKLVRECFEEGQLLDIICSHRASQPIGFNSTTGKPTEKYQVLLFFDYWVVKPSDGRSDK